MSYNEQIGLEQIVLARYVKNNDTMDAISKEFNIPYKKLRELLLRFNVSIRGRGSYTPKGSFNRFSKLSSKQFLEVSELLKQKIRHVEIAKQVGLSRERIRQIAIKLGTPSGRQLQMATTEAIEQKKLEKRLARQKLRNEALTVKFAPWREMWAQGLTIKQIAEKVQMQPGSVGVQVSLLRKKFGDWFPLRRKPKAVVLDKNAKE